MKLLMILDQSIVPTLKIVTVIPPRLSAGRFTMMSGSLVPLSILRDDDYNNDGSDGNEDNVDLSFSSFLVVERFSRVSSTSLSKQMKSPQDMFRFEEKQSRAVLSLKRIFSC